MNNEPYSRMQSELTSNQGELRDRNSFPNMTNTASLTSSTNTTNDAIMMNSTITSNMIQDQFSMHDANGAFTHDNIMNDKDALRDGAILNAVDDLFVNDKQNMQLTAYSTSTNTSVKNQISFNGTNRMSSSNQTTVNQSPNSKMIKENRTLHLNATNSNRLTDTTNRASSFPNSENRNSDIRSQEHGIHPIQNGQMNMRAIADANNAGSTSNVKNATDIHHVMNVLGNPVKQNINFTPTNNHWNSTFISHMNMIPRKNESTQNSNLPSQAQGQSYQSYNQQAQVKNMQMMGRSQHSNPMTQMPSSMNATSLPQDFSNPVSNSNYNSAYVNTDHTNSKGNEIDVNYKSTVDTSDKLTHFSNQHSDQINQNTQHVSNEESRRLEEFSIPRTRSQAQRERKLKSLDPWKDKQATIQVLDLVDKFLSDYGFEESLQSLKKEREVQGLLRDDNMPKSIAYGSDAISLKEIVQDFMNRKDYLGSLPNDSQDIIQRLKDLLEMQHTSGRSVNPIHEPAPSNKYLFVGNNKIKPPLVDPTITIPPFVPIINGMTSGYSVYIPPNQMMQPKPAYTPLDAKENQSSNAKQKQAKSRRKKKAPAKRVVAEPKTQPQPTDGIGEDTLLLDSFPFDEDILGTLLSEPQYAKNIADKINISLDLSPERIRREELVAEELAPEIIRSLGILEDHDVSVNGKRKRIDDSYTTSTKHRRESGSGANLENLARNLEIDVFNDLPDNDDEINNFLDSL